MQQGHKLKANLDNWVRPCLKINLREGLEICSKAEPQPSLCETLGLNPSTKEESEEKRKRSKEEEEEGEQKIKEQRIEDLWLYRATASGLGSVSLLLCFPWGAWVRHLTLLHSSSSSSVKQRLKNYTLHRFIKTKGDIIKMSPILSSQLHNKYYIFTL